jgi:N utilization substance protein B
VNKRSLAREYAFKFVYKHLMPEFTEEKKQLLVNTTKKDEAFRLFDVSYHELDSEHPDNKIDFASKKFAQELIIGSLTQEEDSIHKITPHLSNSNFEKVDKMNLAVLLLGVYEILNDPATSHGVFINEYVNIAKKYCPNESQGFINSILDKIAKENAN